MSRSSKKLTQTTTSSILTRVRQHGNATWQNIRHPRRTWASLQYAIHKRYLWRFGAFVCACTTILVLIVNVTALIIGIVISETHHDGIDNGLGTLYAGSCTRAKNWASGIHAAINIFGGLLLGASNYVMQCLYAPTRQDIDRAHAKRTWLDIGVQGLRNLQVMSRRRLWLWASLLLSTIPIHLFYNAVVFAALSAVEYPVYILPSSAVSQSNTVSIPAQGCGFATEVTLNISAMDKLTRGECLQQYGQEVVSNRGAVVAVTDDESKFTGPNGTVVLTTGSFYYGNIKGEDTTYLPYEWICTADSVQNCLDDPQNRMATPSYWMMTAQFLDVNIWPVVWLYNQTIIVSPNNISDYFKEFQYTNEVLFDDLITVLGNALEVPVSETSLAEDEKALLNSTFRTPGFLDDLKLTSNLMNRGCSSTQIEVSYCLSLPVEEKCELQFSLPISLVVIICNAVKVLCMILTLLESRDDILVTVGDAIASFLQAPDPHTKGMSMLSRDTVVGGPEPWARRGDTFFSRKFLILQQWLKSKGLEIWSQISVEMSWWRIHAKDPVLARWPQLKWFIYDLIEGSRRMGNSVKLWERPKWYIIPPRIESLDKLPSRTPWYRSVSSRRWFLTMSP